MKRLLPLLLLFLAACGGSDNTKDPFQDILKDIYPHKPNASYSSNLVECVTAYQQQKSCLLDALPPISRTTEDVTVEQIMERLVVSHEWMATRFKEVLENSPQFALNLFAPLTAVVISYDVRPAFYHTATGAIYLDPIYLWAEESELATIDLTPDYREGFDDELQFTRLWRYLDSSLSPIGSYSIQNRSVSKRTETLSFLLFHELSHANDFLPPGKRTQIQLPAGNASFYSLVDQIYEQRQTIQYRLTQAFPLTDQVLPGLAQVTFFGEKASSYQKSLTPSEVGVHFEGDDAMDFYSYSTPAEDLAMLLESSLLSYHFGAIRDMAFVENAQESLNIVHWGQRGRLADPDVNQRARFVVSQILPNQADEINQHLLSLAAPESIPYGHNWNSYSLTSAQAASRSRKQEQVPEDLRYRLDYLSHPVRH